MLHVVSDIQTSPGSRQIKAVSTGISNANFRQPLVHDYNGNLYSDRNKAEDKYHVKQLPWV